MSATKSLRTRLGFVFALFAFLFVVNAATVLVLTDVTNARSTDAILVNSLRARSQRIAKDAVIYATLGDVQDARATLLRSTDLFSSTLSALLLGGDGRLTFEEGVHVDPVTPQLAARLRPVETDWLTVREAVRATLAAPPASRQALDAVAPVLTGNVPLLDQLATALTTAISEFEAARDLRTGVSIGLALIAMVIVAAAWRWVGRGIVAPIVDLASAARRIAAGDLRVTVSSVDRVDEIGVLGRAFQDMTTGLRTNLEALRAATISLAASSAEILAASTELTAGATHEAASAAEIAASADEVRATADEATARAADVAGSAARVSEVALSGQAAIEASQRAMTDLRQKVEAIAEQILALSEQTQAIGSITATVEDLAGQSNLLAVNAAIEAAKAGEEGRGFAVVAREVRNMADQSREATEQIRSVLAAVEKAAHSAVLVTEEGTKGVEASSRLVEQAGEVIDQLATAVSESADLARQIAAGTSQQLVGIEQVGAGLSGIVQVSSQTAAASRQLQREAEGLGTLADHLKSLTDGFELHGGTGSAHAAASR
ncbi:MAG TPA: methyl-accepting chemotaxis protein [Patescibacteria group bacterium]|nr:methyl-accepting chemotaxis protein [Patescibacteria group bacterium]